MTLWDVYLVSVEHDPARLIQYERLHSTWETFDEARRQALDLLGHSVRIRERFVDDTPVMRNARGEIVARAVRPMNNPTPKPSI